MDQSIAIQETLEREENCIICNVFFDGTRESKLLGLVKCAEEHAIFIYNHRRMAITADDVSLESIMPISLDFAVVEVSSAEELVVVGADTRVRISYKDKELEITLPFGSHSRLFLSEVNKAWSDVCRLPMQVPKFVWVDKYQKAIKSESLGKQIFGVMGKTTGKPKEQQKKEKSSGSKVSIESGRHIPSPYRNRPTTSSEREDNADLLIKAHILGIPHFGLRDNLVKCELEKKEDTYTYLENFSFFLGTYNVNGQIPKEGLQPWLSCTPDPPDIYCVGFQELDLSKEAFFFNDTPREVEWMKAVTQALHSGSKYDFVKLVRLVGIMLIFYVKSEHAKFITEVEAESVGTGIMGRMGNKGAVSIRFRFHNSEICVVNSHLAAHTEDYERRNQEYKEIRSRLLFRQFDPTQPAITIMKHDVVLWLGDLNYRISDLENEQVKQLISIKDFETLHIHDQLRRQIDLNAVFVGFEEGEIDFQPTYKYDTGSDEWDSSEKCRTPAWCDRILWKGKNIKQLHYQSHMSLKSSDHKPVSGLFVIGIKKVNEEAYKKTFEEIVRSIDKMENECIPSVYLSKREFHFKDVKYMQQQVETFSLKNDGQVPCQFEFIQKPNERTYCKPWLTANPHKGFIAHGGTVEIDLEVFVNRCTAPDLNCGKEKLEEILVLHLERGKDYFITITGNYLPSCYGTSIYSLCQLKHSIRKVPQQRLLELATVSIMEIPETSVKPLDIPKELWMMVDHLFRYGIKEEFIFQQPGLRSEFAKIRDCLDVGGAESLPGTNHSAAEALLLFLDALPEPVVPYYFYQKCLESYSDATESKNVISILPRFHRNVFNYLSAFLREVLKNSDSNRSDIRILASIFASLLLKSPTKQDITEKKKAQEFFQHFLV